MPNIGEVWRKAAFYTDIKTGQPQDKYLLVLGFTSCNDIIYKLLTSQESHRTKEPACFHGLPYPGYYLGVPMPQGRLFKDTWLDLRETDDYDSIDFGRDAANGQLDMVHTFTFAQLCELMDCVANSEDVTGFQRQGIYDSRQILQCA